MAAVYHTVNIYPYPLTNLSVKQENISCTIIDNGTYYTSEDVADGIDFTISCDEYVDKTFSAGSYDAITVYIGNLYAWTIENNASVNPSSASTFYTDSTVPTLQSKFYDVNGISYGDITNWVLTNTEGQQMTQTQIYSASASTVRLIAYI